MFTAHRDINVPVIRKRETTYRLHLLNCSYKLGQCQNRNPQSGFSKIRNIELVCVLRLKILQRNTVFVVYYFLMICKITVSNFLVRKQSQCIKRTYDKRKKSTRTQLRPNTATQNGGIITHISVKNIYYTIYLYNYEVQLVHWLHVSYST